MAVRALIIAIENYPDAKGMAQSLPGTLQAGLDFQNWLLEKLKAEGRDAGAQVIFCSEPVQAGGKSAKRKDLLAAMNQLKIDGRDATDELFVFFSGHGFAFVDKPSSRADVIITSDYTDNVLSGDCCLNLNEIVNWLRGHLGVGKHYYFIDACRNNLNGSQVTVGSLLPTDANVTQDASSFVLQSTTPGAVARVGASFPKMLLEGLQGRGKAKAWNDNVEDKMFVRYDSLRRFLKEALDSKQPITSAVSGEFGEADVVFTQIAPVPDLTCTIEIRGKEATDNCKVAVKRPRSAPDTPRDFGNVTPTFTLKPGTYTFRVEVEGEPVVPPDVTVDLYEDQTVPVQKALPASGLETLSQPTPPETERLAFSHLKLSLSPNARLLLHNRMTNAVHEVHQTGEVKLPAGSYTVKMLNSANHLLLRKDVELAGGESISLSASTPHLSITNMLPGSPVGPDFSESLGGPVRDRDLNLWLALLGGGRILGSKGDYSKIVRFPLHDFSDEKAGASPVYVLAGFDEKHVKFQVSVSNDKTTRWESASEPNGLSGIREAYVSAQAGRKLISFRIGDDPPYTIASVTSPNRATLLTVTLDSEGEYYLSQYLLPLGHLIAEFPQAVRDRLISRNQLNDVRLLAQASRAFRKRRNLLKEALSPIELNDLLLAKWLDPIGASLAIYELLRRGRGEQIDEAVSNMEKYFPDFPDTAAIARLAGRSVYGLKGVPLFFDGLRAYPEYAQWLPLPKSHLDFTSPWTAWRAAVS